MRSRSLLGLVGLVVVGCNVVGCLERPIRAHDTRSTAMVVEPLKLSAVERIDLLLAIDNSASMGDKQEILARAVPDLVKRLANPRCVDSDGTPAADQPKSPTAECPKGTEREFLAVPDIHIGIVSSSLGGPKDGVCDGATENDHARLLSRDQDGNSVATYGGHGFLAWDPDKMLDPPGETVLDENGTGLVPTLQEMVRGVGETGCSFEGQLESWYRFLIDPDPHDKLVLDGDDLVATGTDHTLLDQRKQFLRPDSLVAIVMLSDENDCSIMPGEGAAKLYSSEHLVRPRSECAEDPNDECCAPCDAAPSTCAPDPQCKDAAGQWARLEQADDPLVLRCFNQKERFGRDYLYPLARYKAGLNDAQILDRHGDLKPNPLFVDLNPDDDVRGTRNAGLVFLAGIVGVPWQDVAKDPLSLTKGLKSAKELAERDQQGRSGWDFILGNPATGAPPLDPHMIEQTAPREGNNPITGTSIQPPTAGPMADPISGHEQPASTDALQYSCIFPLLEPIVCSGQAPGCGCNTYEGDPLCQAADGTYSATQLYAKAYPAVRELTVLKDIGEQAIVASVCPANMDDATSQAAADFGYRPAIGALVDRLKEKLGHQCLPRELTPDEDGQVSCLVIEARTSNTCSCEAKDGRTAVTQEHASAIDGALESGVISDADNCFCEIPQLEGDELSACQNEGGDPIVVDDQQVNGWCYIDATTKPPVGSPELVPDSCTDTERRLVRLVGTAKARPGSTLFIMCQQG